MAIVQADPDSFKLTVASHRFHRFHRFFWIKNVNNKIALAAILDIQIYTYFLLNVSDLQNLHI